MMKRLTPRAPGAASAPGVTDRPVPKMIQGCLCSWEMVLGRSGGRFIFVIPLLGIITGDLVLGAGVCWGRDRGGKERRARGRRMGRRGLERCPGKAGPVSFVLPARDVGEDRGEVVHPYAATLAVPLDGVPDFLR